MAKQSCEIAAMLINQEGGILGGRQVQIVVEDDACEPKTGALAATKRTGQKGVAASVSTCGSSICEPASNIHEKARMVNIGDGVTAVRLTERGLTCFFRTCGRGDSQGLFFAEYVPQRFAANRIAIMHDNTAPAAMPGRRWPAWQATSARRSSWWCLPRASRSGSPASCSAWWSSAC